MQAKRGQQKMRESTGSNLGWRLKVTVVGLLSRDRVRAGRGAVTVRFMDRRDRHLTAYGLDFGGLWWTNRL